MDDIRRKRVEEELRSEIAALILTGEIKDPRINAFLSITRVDVARDASAARVYVSTFEEGEALAKGVEGLNSAAGFIQAAVGRKIRLRLTPRLKFFADEGIRRGFEMGEKIKDLFP